MISEAEGSLTLRQLQQKVFNYLPTYMQKLGVPFQKVRELNQYDKYPRLGMIPLDQLGATGVSYSVSAEPMHDSDVAWLFLTVDVGTSNDLYNHPNPEKAKSILMAAEKLASLLGVKVIPYSNLSAKHQHMAPSMEVKVDIPASVPSDTLQPSSTSQQSMSYDPRERFMNTPGERAKQSRVNGSAYSDSFGGDSSNYRR